MQKKEADMNIYEFLKDCRKQIIGKRDTLIEAAGEHKFNKLWGEVYECLI